MSEAEINIPYSDTFSQSLMGLSPLIIDVLAQQCYKCSADHGFWDEQEGLPMNKYAGEKIALMHSELSEALEAVRGGDKPDKHCPEFSNLEVELADCMIRILDFAGKNNLNLGDALLAKYKVNLARPHKHGKAF